MGAQVHLRVPERAVSGAAALETSGAVAAQPLPTICSTCGAALCGRQVVIAKILGWSVPRCLDCAAADLGSSPDALCSLVGGYLSRRECYRRDWMAAATCGEDDRAPCCPGRVESAEQPPEWFRAELFHPGAGLTADDADQFVDAEESGCGDLMVLLLRSIRKTPPGGILGIRALDPGAPADIPSWCRLTGHELLRDGEDDGVYYIRRCTD